MNTKGLLTGLVIGGVVGAAAGFGAGWFVGSSEAAYDPTPWGVPPGYETNEDGQVVDAFGYVYPYATADGLGTLRHFNSAPDPMQMPVFQRGFAPYSQTYFTSDWVTIIAAERIEGSYPVGEIDSQWVPMGGFADPGRYKVGVYMQPGYRGSAEEDDWIVSTLHHELSSVILAHSISLFPFGAWFAAMPDDFEYGGKHGFDFLQAGDTSVQFTLDEVRKHGIFTSYAGTNIEEDINSYAGMIFIKDERFWRMYEEIDVVRRKANVLMDFYRTIGVELPDVPPPVEERTRSAVFGQYLPRSD